MKTKLWLFTMLTLPLLADTSESQFIGFSATAVPAYAGLAGMAKACQGTFGARARMCLTDEVVKTPDIVYYTQNLEAWVQPGSKRFPCAGWGSTLGSATVLDARTMSLARKPCKALLAVTCCR